MGKKPPITLHHLRVSAFGKQPYVLHNTHEAGLSPSNHTSQFPHEIAQQAFVSPGITVAMCRVKLARHRQQRQREAGGAVQPQATCAGS